VEGVFQEQARAARFQFQFEKMKVEELEVLQLQSAEETQKTITKLTQIYGKQREDLAGKRRARRLPSSFPGFRGAHAHRHQHGRYQGGEETDPAGAARKGERPNRQAAQDLRAAG
jgi:hypothetical protein